MVNKVFLMGRLTKNPELSQSQNGKTICRFSVAVDRSYSKNQQEKQADFFNVVCFGKTADFVGKYFSKGKLIHVEGRIQNNNYTDQSGVKHYNMDIVASEVNFCGDKSGNQQGGQSAANPPSYAANQQQNQPYQQPAPPPQYQQQYQQPYQNPYPGQYPLPPNYPGY